MKDWWVQRNQFSLTFPLSIKHIYESAASTWISRISRPLFSRIDKMLGNSDFLHAVDVGFPPLRSAVPPPSSCSCSSFNIWNKGDSSSSLLHSSSYKQWKGDKTLNIWHRPPVTLWNPRIYKMLPEMSGMDKRERCAESFVGGASTWKEKFELLWRKIHFRVLSRAQVILGFMD